MRVIVAGSRNVTQNDVFTALRECPWMGFATAIVSGTARGADAFGERWAKENNLPVIRYPADWKTHGRAAGPIRNKRMSENAEGLVAVWDGKSRGTENMVAFGVDRGLRVAVFMTDSRTLDKKSDGRGDIADLWDQAEERAGIMEYAGNLERSAAEREAGLEALRLRGQTDPEPTTPGT